MRFAPLAAAVVLAWQWRSQDSHTQAGLRGVHAISDTVAWASGTGGSVLLFNNNVWKTCSPPSGAEKLDFRGVRAWDERRAIVMSSGPGDASRLYRTEDGCRSWRLLASNTDKNGFWDALMFLDTNNGYLLGDPVDGRFVAMRTTDGGAAWHRDQSAELRAEPGEGAFAASNSSLAITPEGDVFFGTGGKAGARIFHRSGHFWSAAHVPLGHKSETGGVFSVAFRDGRHGIAVGGDFKQPNEGKDCAIWTNDNGATWNAAQVSPSGYRSSVAWSTGLHAWIAVGPSGSDVSRDDGVTWQSIDRGKWNALSLPWVSGPDGRLAKLLVVP